jgi:hypothetical protein
MVKLEDIPEDSIIFYDIETGPPTDLAKFCIDQRMRKPIESYKGAISAAYCQLHMKAYQLGLNGEPQLVETEAENQVFRDLLRDPNILKVSYNGINFDDIVLWRYGYYVEPRGRHDMYLALKTCAPMLYSYSLKYVNEVYFGDSHDTEGELFDWLLHSPNPDLMYKAPKNLLAEYCKHDVRQTANVFRMIWEVIQRPIHWHTYRRLEIKMAEPLHEMILQAGEWVSVADINNRILELLEEQTKLEMYARRNFGIANLGSQKEITTILHHKFGKKFAVSEAGNFIFRKLDKLHLMSEAEDSTAEIKAELGHTILLGTDSPEVQITKLHYGYIDLGKVVSYLRSYYLAARYEQQRRANRRNGNHSKGKDCGIHPSTATGSLSESGDRATTTNGQGDKGSNKTGLIKIPKSYYLSGARTRRILSSSLFGINFQNQNKRSKVVQLVPPGWLGAWFDLTQIENVVHIYESADEARRISYEEDPDWSEYVWLVNTVMGEERTKDYWDSIDSPENPQWSIYKQYKTIKLALNFGMGVDKFTKTTGLSREKAVKLFDRVQQACPAIRDLQSTVRNNIKRDGFVTDAFGHIYAGSAKSAYKVVAYLIQGCGTGSVPKAMTVANYETLHSIDSIDPIYFPNIRHRYKQTYAFTALSGLTHDEIAFRISLGVPIREIVRLVRECIYNMEEKFSDRFDNIPLRVKCYFSVTNASEQKELDHRKPDFDEKLIAIIKEGRQCVTATE